MKHTAAGNTLAAVFLFVLLAGCAGGPTPHPGLTGFTRDELRQGYRIEGKNIVFAFDPGFMTRALQSENLDPAALKTVRIAGSFTGWKQRDAWNLKRLPGSPAWILKRPVADILIPGNSGRPEFAFCVVKQVSHDVYWLKPKEDVPFTRKVSDQHTGQYNYVVILMGDNREEIKKINSMINNPEKNGFTDNGLTANFRTIRAGQLKEGLFYRSYHPFTPSKQGPMEKKRTATALTLMETHAINAVINLTDGTSLKKQSGIPIYYRALLDSGRVLLAKTEYNTVYFKSDTKKFETVAGRVFQFILEQKGPFLIHCRLGTDRTGVISAVIAGLGGATWKEIRADYERTNDSRMGEYRSGALLRYSLEKLLGFRITEKMKLDTALIKWIQEKGILGKSQLRDLLKKIRG